MNLSLSREFVGYHITNGAGNITNAAATKDVFFNAKIGDSHRRRNSPLVFRSLVINSRHGDTSMKFPNRLAEGRWFLMHHVNVAWIMRPQAKKQSIQPPSMT